jgi:multiple sugar transport system ATP-binding protein
MNNGVIEQVGPPLELFDNPANVFVATFLGFVA